MIVYSAPFILYGAEMNKHFSSSVVFLILRIFFGFIYVFSGITKLLELSSFKAALLNFNIIPASTVIAFVYLIPIIEIFLGIMVGVKINPALFSKGIVYLTCLFTAAITLKLFEGEEISCGCFGNLSDEPINIMTVLRNVILIFIGISIIVYYENYGKKNITLIMNTITKVSWITLSFFLLVQAIIFGVQNRELKNRLTFFISEQEVLAPGDIVKPTKVKNMLNKEYEITFDSTTIRSTLIFLLSTKCEPCKQNFPNWIYLYNKLTPKHVRIIAVAMDSLSNLNEFIMSYKPPFEVYSNPNVDFKLSYKGFITPQTIVIDRKGVVIKTFTGILNKTKTSQLIDIYNQMSYMEK